MICRKAKSPKKRKRYHLFFMIEIRAVLEFDGEISHPQNFQHVPYIFSVQRHPRHGTCRAERVKVKKKDLKVKKKDLNPLIASLSKRNLQISMAIIFLFYQAFFRALKKLVLSSAFSGPEKIIFRLL